MSNETKTPTSPLANVSNKEDFTLPIPGKCFMHQGLKQDLRKIDRHTAEVLANDPAAKFIEWAPGKGPNAAKAKEEPPGKDAPKGK